MGLKAALIEQNRDPGAMPPPPVRAVDPNDYDRMDQLIKEMEDLIEMFDSRYTPVDTSTPSGFLSRKFLLAVGTLVAGVVCTITGYTPDAKVIAAVVAVIANFITVEGVADIKERGKG